MPVISSEAEKSVAASRSRAALRLLLLFYLIICSSLPTYAVTITLNIPADGTIDDTAAIQSALDTAGKTGGAVTLPAGQYLIADSLNIPVGVVLEGSWQAPHTGATDKGTTLLITGGRGHEDGTPTITLQTDAALRGVTMVWPDQKADNITPYPWAIAGLHDHNTVENVTFINAYQGIVIGPNGQGGGLHLIRNVFGCVLRRGVYVAFCADIGRIENVHFNPDYWTRSNYAPIETPNPDKYIYAYTEANQEAFIFGRSDWEYVQGAFVYGAEYGYRFIHTPDGDCNGELVNIGADGSHIGVLIDKIQSVGIQITNGEFTAFTGGANAGVVISPGVGGPVQLVNCDFWATPGGAVLVNGNSQVVVNSCHFADSVAGGVIVARAGHVNVSNCSFAGAGTTVKLLPGTKAAVVTGNLQTGGLLVDNQIGGNAIIGLNEAPTSFPDSELLHYRVKIGADGDDSGLGSGWNGAEEATDIPSDLKPDVHNARWTNGNAILHLPVIPGDAYTLTLWLSVPPKTPAETVSVDGVGSRQAKVGDLSVLTFKIPTVLTLGKHEIDVHITGGGWQPSVLNPPSQDTRTLGARIYAVEMQAAGASKPFTYLNH